MYGCYQMREDVSDRGWKALLSVTKFADVRRRSFWYAASYPLSAGYPLFLGSVVVLQYRS